MVVEEKKDMCHRNLKDNTAYAANTPTDPAPEEVWI